jgi:hypothetical protein
MRTREEKILLAMGVLAASAAAAIPSFMVPPFRETYATLGIEPSFIARPFLEHGLILWLLPRFSRGVALLAHTASKRTDLVPDRHHQSCCHGSPADSGHVPTDLLDPCDVLKGNET